MRHRQAAAIRFWMAVLMLAAMRYEGGFSFALAGESTNVGEAEKRPIPVYAPLAAGVRLEASAGKAEYFVGEPAVVALTIINESDEPFV